MKIKNIVFKNNLILAPMADVTDVGFRSLAIDSGADAGVTELISAKALVFNNEKTLAMLATAENEKIKIVQLFGNEPDIMAKACVCDALKKFDIIDINMGCPAPKIVKNGQGAALMKDINLAEEIIKACVKVSDKPITVKFRAGWDNDHINAVEFAKMCERAGASAITIHARTKEQLYGGTADLDIIKQVVNAVNIPVIGNGDVCDKASYEHMKQFTGCAAVMVGRAALGRPYVFTEILGKKNTLSQSYYIKKHIAILRKYFPETFVVKHMRKHILWYVRDERNVTKLRVKVVNEPKLDNVVKMIDDFYSGNMVE